MPVGLVIPQGVEGCGKHSLPRKERHRAWLLADGDSIKRGCMKMGAQGIPGDFGKRGVCDGDVDKARILAQVSLVKSRQDVGASDLIYGL